MMKSSREAGNRPHQRGISIAEGKRAARSSRHGEEYFQSLIENAHDAIAVIDGDGKVSYESPSFQHMLGYKYKERVGKNSFELVHPDDVPKAAELFAKLIENPSITIHTEIRARHSDGSLRTLEVVGRNLLDDQVVGGIVANFCDITDRKRADEELRIKENAVENSLGAVAMCDMEGNITYVNQACLTLWGWDKKEELVGENYRVFLDLDEVTVENARATMEKRIWEGELVTKGKDGEERHVQVHGGVVTDDNGNPVQVISSFSDITERREVEEALRKSEEKFRHFVEEMNDGYCVIQDSRIAFANARIAEMFGYTLEEAIGRAIHDLVPSGIVKELARVHARRQRGDVVPPQYETVLTRKDGTECPVEFGARLMEYEGKPAVSVVIRDITERKLLEEALRESETRFRKIFEEAALGIVLVDLKGKPIEINPAWQRLIGYGVEELRSMAGRKYLHPEDALEDSALFKEMLAGKREQYHIERRYICKNGGVIWVHQHLSIVRGARGEPLFFIAMMEDITDRKKMEQQLQLTGRLAAVGELAAGVAHELNNPLAAVQAFAQLLNDRNDLDETARNDVEIIYREAQRASKITGNLLSFAYQRKLDKSLISINEAVERSLELYAYPMKVSNIVVTTDLDPVIPMTMADFHQMQQVFVNIINNAKQAVVDAHGGGRLYVKTEKMGDVIRMTFIDDGPGISQENQKRIFDPFFTTKDVGKGTGLGLSICYGIVESHGGRIYVESVPGEGAKFVVEIPIVTEKQPVAG